MHSAYANKKEPIYFQMTELEVATVFTVAAKTILWQMVLYFWAHKSKHNFWTKLLLLFHLGE